MNSHFLLTTRLTIVLLALLALQACSPSQPASQNHPTEQEIAQQLAQRNQLLVQAIKTQSFAEIAPLYDENTLLMAEYHPLIQGQEAIRHYYEQVFERETIQTYSRENLEILPLEDRVLEMGLFTKVLATGERYRGKYLNVWKYNPQGELTLRAESFGYLHSVDNPSSLVVSLPEPGAPQAIELPWEMEAYNALNENNVRDRIPERSANAYTENAVYLPFADSLKRGKATLLKHYQGYYQTPVRIDSIQGITYAYDRVGDGYIRYTGFYVDWTVLEPTFSGTTTGTGISYWRREADNSLRIHRQIGLHIHQE